MPLPPGFDAFAEETVALARSIGGHLTDREARFLCMIAVAAPGKGEVLEIGSFQGRSTVILARSVRFAGGGRVVAVDPLSFPSETDPEMADRAALPEVFRRNLRTHGVEDVVEFHQMLSHELGATWDRPLRVLWIDGDHTYAGAHRDFVTFAPSLAPGAIVALHDVLHGFDGPDRVLCEGILQNPAFGACGICGSIGWGQYLGDEAAAAPHADAKRRLERRIRRLLPHVRDGRPPRGLDRQLYRLKRALVPHAGERPEVWVRTLVGAGERRD